MFCTFMVSHHFFLTLLPLCCCSLSKSVITMNTTTVSTNNHNENNHHHHGNSSVITGNDDQSSRSTSGLVIGIYPLSSYYFGSKDPVPFKDESLVDRVLRLKSNYDVRGIRTCVKAIMLVELFKHPHLLLLQERNSTYELPGGRIRPGETDIEGLRRKLSSKLSLTEDAPEWEVGECLGMWYRPDFESILYPYLPPNVKLPKECIKLYLVRLPGSRKFIVPRNLKLLAVPLCQIHENHKVISGVPLLLSKFSVNIIDS